MSKAKREVAQAKTDALEELLDRAVAATSLESWSALVRAVDVPTDLAAALIAQRPELLALAQPRAMSAAEVAGLYKLLGVLIETNIVLQEHARTTARMVDNWLGAFKHLNSVGGRIQEFASFRHPAVTEDEEGDEA